MSKNSHVKPAKAEDNTEEMKENSQETWEKKQENPQADGAKTGENQDSAPSEAKETASNPEPVSLEQKQAGQIKELEAKLAELNDQFLRKAADLENFRKRTLREKQELTDFANQNLLLDLLPVIDDFERAIKSAETSKDFHSFYDGITLIEKRLSAQLESKWALKRFDSAGEVFDPERHEAIQMEKTDGITEAVVKEDYVKGYLLKDKVIRFAKVKVLMPKDSEQGTENKEQWAGSNQQWSKKCRIISKETRK